MSHEACRARIAVIEDDLPNLEWVAAEVRGLPGVELIGCYFSFEEFNQAKVGVDLVILDRWIKPDPSTTFSPMSSFDVVSELVRRKIKVVIRTMDPDPGPAILELSRGADAVVSKASRSSHALMDAIEASLRGEKTVEGPILKTLWEDQTVIKALTLTDRQKTILKWKIAGLATAQIARRENLSTSAVDGHITEIYRRIRTYLEAAGPSWAARLDATNDKPPLKAFEFLVGLDPMRDPTAPLFPEE